MHVAYIISCKVWLASVLFNFFLSPSCFDVMEEMVCVVLVCVLVHVQDSLLWLGGYSDFDARLVIMTQFWQLYKYQAK